MTLNTLYAHEQTIQLPDYDTPNTNAGHDLNIHELTNLDNPIALTAVALYLRAFPIEERETLENLEATVRHSRGAAAQHHFWAVVDAQSNALSGLAIFTTQHVQRMGFLRFLAIREDLRGYGLGSTLLNLVTHQVSEDGIDWNGKRHLGTCIEVERPETAETDADYQIRMRRIRFYQRNGAFIVPSIDLVAPPNAPALPPVPYHLMFHPAATCSTVLTSADYRAMAQTVLVKGYGVELDSPYYLNAIRAVG